MTQISTSVWDADVVGSSLAHCATMLALDLFSEIYLSLDLSYICKLCSSYP